MVKNCTPPCKRPRLDDEIDTRLREKKLVLVLDLDNTLIVSKSGRSLSPNDFHLLNEPDIIMHQADERQPDLFTWVPVHFTMLTKLRPSARLFLKQASILFDMYIYTAAPRQYAHCIARLLDPDQEYFHNRIFSAEDSSRPGKKGLDIVQHDQRFVIIVDDKEEVWPNNKDNLIQIADYQFFSGIPRLVKPLSESKVDDEINDGVLDGILDVLTRAHSAFFDDPPLPCRDVRVVLREIKQQTLKGCTIVFGKVSPPDDDTKPVVSMAKEMGAICCNAADDSVTHVVSSSAKIKLTRWAVKKKKFLVTPLWIETAYYSWRRQNEGDFRIEDQNSEVKKGTKKESWDRVMDNVKEELAQAKRDRDEAEKECLALTNIVTELSTQREEMESEQATREKMEPVEESTPPAKRQCLRPYNDDTEKRLQNKKLVLVLDLDNTLVDTRLGRNLSPNELHLFSHPELKIDRHGSLITWIAVGSTAMTKLRPSVQSFLRQASTLFDMYIYTEANRHDAIAIVKLLDPKQEYFHNRIISGDESSQIGVKGLDLVQHDERFVVVVDDNEELWREDDRENLIHVPKYQYFSSSTNSGAVKPLSESKMNEDEVGNVLDGVLEVLTRAHMAFFDNPSPQCGDVRVVLKEMKQNVLKGCKIVLSAEVKGKPVRTMAEEMGAITCTMDNVDAFVTHVVCVSLKSKFANWAVKNNKFLVTPLWVESAYFSWRRQNESDFQIDVKAIAEQNGRPEKEKKNEATSEKKEKNTVEENSLKTHDGVKKEFSDNRRAPDAAMKEKYKNRSLYRDMTQIKEELDVAKRERDEARKRTFALSNIVTQLCTQVSYLTEVCEARSLLHQRAI